MRFISKCTVSVTAAVCVLMTTIMPASATAGKSGNNPASASKISVSANSEQPVKNSESNTDGVLDLNSNGVENGQITEKGGSVTYKTVAEQDCDDVAWLGFNNQRQNCSLTVQVKDSSGAIISSSLSNTASSVEQQARVRVKSGNTVLFTIKHTGTDTPHIDYSLCVGTVTNVKDSNEPNDSLHDVIGSKTSAPLNQEINADFDNPIDVDWYRVVLPQSGALQVSCLSDDASDIGIEIYGENNGTLSKIAEGKGQTPKFDAYSYFSYYVGVYSCSRKMYDYTMKLTTSSSNPTLPYTRSNSGLFALADLTRAPTGNVNIYDSYAKISMSQYMNETGYFRKINNIDTPKPVNLPRSFDNIPHGMEGYVKSVNDIQVYRSDFVHGDSITWETNSNDLKFGVAIYANDGTKIYENASPITKKAYSPAYKNPDIVASDTIGAAGDRYFYQIKTFSAVANITSLYIYLFPIDSGSSASTLSAPIYYSIWAGHPVYGMAHSYLNTGSNMIRYPSTQSSVQTVDVAHQYIYSNIPETAYMDTIHFIQNKKFANLASNATFRYKQSSKSSWHEAYSWNDYEDTFIEKTPVRSSFDFQYRIRWSPNASIYSLYQFGWIAHIDYVYELGSCTEPYDSGDPSYGN